jgi:hypothetical protein
MNRARLFLLSLAVWSASACGSRPGYWDQSSPAPGIKTFGLEQGVGLVDANNNRLTFLTALPDQRLSAQHIELPHSLVATVVSPDQKSVFFLAAGDPPSPTGNAQLPSLEWVARSPASGSAPGTMVGTQYWMSDPLQNFAVDPQEHWAVAYAGAQTNFVQNANELVLFDLTQPPNPATPSSLLDMTRPPNPIARDIQAFGGIPKQLVFTGPLDIGGGVVQHLLIIETDIDVTLLDLEGAFPVAPATASPETTVRLTSGADATMVTPAGVAVYPGDANGPARIAIRSSDDTNIFTLVLGSSAPTINLTDVGGIPSDIAFVKTDAATNGGLRVAALVPSSSSAVLVDPDTSLTTIVALGAAYSSLSLVTQALGSAAQNVDVALLWGAPAGATSYEVALWTLVDTVDMPYRSVQGVAVSQAVQGVNDVPGNAQLKVLEVTGGNEFVVLNLTNQTAAPLDTTQSATMTIAPDGGRMWVFAPGATDLAAIDFSDLNPIRLETALPINAVYDVARVDSTVGTPERSLIAIHNQGTVGATVFDALKPAPTTSRRADALLLEGP